MIQVSKDVTTQLMFAYNGKFGGGRIILSPTSVINDGKFELYMCREAMNTPKLIRTFGQAITGGEHYYEPLGSIYSIRKLRMENKSKKFNHEIGQYETSVQDVNIDGEDL